MKLETHEISGAGPAGLAAAITLAKAGRRVTLYERRPEVGGRFHGDFQGLENWTTSGDVLEELAQAGIEASFEATPFNEGAFFDPDGGEHHYRSDQPLFYLVRRGGEPCTLDDSLTRQAVAAGVEIRFGHTKDHLSDGGIVAQGPRGPDAIAVGYVFETDADDIAMGVLSDALAPKGYSYLLVHDGRGTIASCMFDQYHDERRYLERTVEFFEKKSGITMKSPRRFGGLGNFDVPASAVRGKLLFAGESAGFQDALWGFGMRYAMLSGHLAARSLIEGTNYDQVWKRRLGGLMKSGIANRAAYDILGDTGYRKLMAQLDNAPDPRAWLHNHYAPSIWKSLIFPLARRRVRTRRKDSACIEEGCDCTWCRCAHNTQEKEDLPAKEKPNPNATN